MKSEAKHCFDLGTVRFVIFPEGSGGTRVLAEISEDALRDVFGAMGGPDSLLNACEANFQRIEEIATDLYRRRPAWPVQVEIVDCLSVTGEKPTTLVAPKGSPA